MSSRAFARIVAAPDGQQSACAEYFHELRECLRTLYLGFAILFRWLPANTRVRGRLPQFAGPELDRALREARIDRIEHAKKDALEIPAPIGPPLASPASARLGDDVPLQVSDVEHAKQRKRPEYRREKASNVLAEGSPRRLIPRQRGTEIVFVKSKQKDPCSQRRHDRYRCEQPESMRASLRPAHA
jgi:hypothetical protein